MKFFNNIHNKKTTNNLNTKWLFIIILSSLFLITTIYFFYYIFTPSDSGKVKEIKKIRDMSMLILNIFSNLFAKVRSSIKE